MHYDFNLGDLGKLSPRIDYTYVTKIENDAPNTSYLVAPAHSMLDGSVNYTFPNNHFELQAGVKNITDKRIIVSGFITDGIASGTYSRPREWFLTLKVHG